LSAQNIAFNEVARQAITKDPDFKGGEYYKFESPKRGLMLARMLGHITYLSEDSMHNKFGRDLRDEKFGFDYGVDFEVESYLRYQGESFVNRFDANTYLLMTKVLDYFDPASKFNGSLATAFAKTHAKFLVVSFTTDWRFSSQRSHEIIRALAEAEIQMTYAEIADKQGHDSFLMAIPQYINVLNAYMQHRVEPSIK
ncbi:MAG: homoserine O-acetyltransferase, partial [Candidatus Oxydemutatoraceae bacterium WSBS_2016_MAG_OTU14]